MSALTEPLVAPTEPPTGARPRVLFLGNSTYDLPLPASLARKWNLLAERLELRVIGRAGNVAAQDPRFHLVRVRAPGRAGSYHARLAAVVAREVNAFRPDVVVAQSAYEALPFLAARPLMRGRRPELIVEVHGDWRTATRMYGTRARRAAAGVADRAALFALRRASAVRALPGFASELAREATGCDPVAVFPAYFDLTSFVADPIQPLPERPRVAWVGGLQHVKNPRTFAAAWRQVAARLPEAHAVVVGDGPLRGVIDKLVAEFPQRVIALPRIAPAEVARVLDESTVLALPSRSEGLPRVVIEAFSRGRPVVGAAAGGIPDLVEPGRNGSLVEPDDATALADALVRVLGDPELAERLARGARDAAPALQRLQEGYADSVAEMVGCVLRRG